ncbi:hypothetical protein FKP32DRAFT_1753474, partial [Trametes sanguinea]
PVPWALLATRGRDDLATAVPACVVGGSPSLRLFLACLCDRLGLHCWVSKDRLL